MYLRYFGLNENPFSITPDPRYVFMSQRHREALAHLVYGTQQSGGFIQLTGEVGTGKTTLTRLLLQQIPVNVEVALLINPRQTALEFVRSICDELFVSYNQNEHSLKALIDVLNSHLIKVHEQGKRVILLIDEAQNLSPEVLEQIRLLTNLETSKQKLLQIILVGQPELRLLLARRELRQLAQRITARYHLLPLSEQETFELILHRLSVAGLSESPFTNGALHQVYKFSNGIPRVINVVCDRAMLGAYSLDKKKIDAKIVKKAAVEVIGETIRNSNKTFRFLLPAAVSGGLVVFGIAWALIVWSPLTFESSAGQADQNQFPASIKSPTASAIDTQSGKAVLKNNNPDNNAVKVKNRSSINSVFDNPNLPSDTESAFAELFSLWSKDYYNTKSDNPCDKAKDFGLQCLYDKGTWNNLRTLNRPALIELIDTNGNRHHMIVSALGEENVTLSFAGNEYVYPISALDPFWRGEFLILWKPPVSIDVIQKGIRGNATTWLKHTLDKIEGKTSPEKVDNLFDDELKNRVIAFQHQRHLTEDGVVGQQTMIHLNTGLNDPAIPLLSATTIQ